MATLTSLLTPIVPPESVVDRAVFNDGYDIKINNLKSGLFAIANAIDGGTNAGAFPSVTLSGPTTAQPGGVSIGPFTTTGIGIVNSNGSTFAIQNSSTSPTANANINLLPLLLEANATADFTPGQGGTMLVVVPGATTCPMAHIGFAADGTTSLNGVTPTSGISLTLDNASTLNVYAAAGKVRFQNKTGGTIKILATIFTFQSA